MMAAFEECLHVEHCLNTDELYKLIDRKASEFYERYCCRPKYIKIPEWVYYALKQSHFNFLARPERIGVSPNEPDKLFGYRVCETITIEQIEDIELF